METEAPVLQAYVFDPEAVKVAVLPEHSVAVAGEMLREGMAFTETVLTTECVQPPKVLVPVTV